jgi:YVTN family beta-propeller protein
MKVKVWKLLGLIFTIIFALSAAHAAYAAGVIGTIKVGINPWGVAYDSGKNEIFVTNEGSNTTSVISDSNNAVVDNVPVGTYPMDMAYDSGKGEIFVANDGSNTVSVISDSNNTVVDNVPVGTYPMGVAYDSGMHEIFVANEGSKTVSVIPDSVNAVVYNVPVGTYPMGVAYDSGKNEIFVTNDGSNTVSVISAGDTVLKNVTVGTWPWGAAYDSGKGEIFVANVGSNTVSVISDSNNTVVANVTVGARPTGVAYDSGKGEIFVTNQNSNSVSVISDSTNNVIAWVPVGTYPVGVAYDSGKGEIFVTNEGSKTVSVYSILVAPSVSSSLGTMDQGQTSNLTSAVTTGAGPYEYQWFSEVPRASSYSSIGGATSSSYNFVTSTSTATGSWNFMFQVTDTTGAAVNSTAATVTVNVAPTVSITPASWTMDVGQSKLFTSSVSGGTSTYSYQWYLNGVANGTSSSWTFKPSSSGSYSLYVNVTDNVGVRAKSNVASVTVNVALSATVSPASATLGVGQSKAFNASVSGGASPYSYQWYLNGSLVSGATSSSWSFKPTSAGVYIIYVKTTDALNDVVQSSNVQVKVTAAGLGLIGIALIGVVVAAVACVGAVGYKMRKRPEKPPTPTELKIQTEPTEIIADGKSKSTITVQLLDKKGQPIAALADTEVKLTTTGGKIESSVIKIPKGKDTGTTALTSSTQSGEVTLLADATKLKTQRAQIIFSEKARFCMGCGSRIAVKEATCKKCGASPVQFAGPETKKCGACDTTIPSPAKFCSECGAKQSTK